MQPGSHVRVLPPFAEFFPDVYEVESVETVEGGDIVHLVGVDPVFSPINLEVADV